MVCCLGASLSIEGEQHLWSHGGSVLPRLPRRENDIDEVFAALLINSLIDSNNFGSS
jgi:hypothetical protein